jgi:nucleoside-diphosphate-sugar epimerase
MAEVAAGNGRYAGVRAVVIGASGFVGSSVARALCAWGADLVCVVRNRRAAAPRLRSVEARIVERELCDESSVAELLGPLEPSVVFNLAGYGVDPDERDEVQARVANADLVEWVCRGVALARDREWHGAALVHAGTAAEYGAAGGVFSESTEPRPTTVYGRTKLEGTRRLATCCAALGLRGVTARLFTVYGPGEDEGRLLPALLAAARTGAPLSLTAGLQRRDFTFVGDVAEGLLRLGLSRDVRAGEVVNLATGRLLSVRQFTQVASSVLGIPENHLHFGALPTRPDEMEHDGVSVARLRAILSWVPATSIEDGIRATAEAERGGHD